MGKYDEFGALLASYRRDKGLNQIALAEQCGVKQSRISHFETGRSRPKAELLECFARALQLTPYQKKRLLLSAGYVEDGEQKLSEILIDSELRPIFILLSDPVLSNIPIPLAKTTIKDLTKGWHLYVQAKEKQLKREWSGTEEICELALEIIQTASTHLVAYLYDAVGSAAIHRGNFNEAEDRFDHVEILLSKVNDAYLEGKLLVHQGELLRFQSDWPQSEKKFLDAKKIFLDLTKTESLKQCAWVDRKIGVLYLMQGKWERGNSFLERSEETFRDSSNAYELAKTCNALGWGYTLRGDWHKALGYHLEGYRLTQDHRVMDQPDHFLRMQGHVYLGLSLHQTGFIDQAQKHFEAAKVISDKLEEFNERNIILVGLAHLYHDRFIRSGKTDISMFNAAEEYYQTTARKTEKAGDKYRYARTLLYQSQLYLSAGNEEKAIDLLKESQQIFRVLEHHYYLSYTAIYLGKAFKEAGRYENLKFYVEDGIGEALRYRFPYHRHLSELRFLKALVLCHNRQGQDTMRQLAHCLVDAILFNRFQCEKIADQLVVELEKDSYLRNEVARTKGRHLQVFFDQRIRRDKNSQTHSQKQEKLVVDVTDWLKELGQNPSAKFPKRAHADVQILLEDADI